jgi:hypothetical protein
MTEANKMKQSKEEKQKMVVVKKKGNLGEKLEEVRKRHERDKGGSWNGTCNKKKNEEK